MIDPIPFGTFARFERLTAEEPLLYVDPPAWAAAVIGAHPVLQRPERLHIAGSGSAMRRAAVCHLAPPVVMHSVQQWFKLS